MKKLLQIQGLDLKIEHCKAREIEIPKQKNKFDVQKKRLAGELVAREEATQRIILQVRECETDNEQKAAQIQKYDEQLLAVKKNEEYQALLHEIDALKKQINLNEERIIQGMMDQDESKARLEEDKKRIDVELKDIDRQCAEIDTELEEAIKVRKALEQDRGPLVAETDQQLLSRYTRIRASMKVGAAAVPLSNNVCTGCHMFVTPQIVNEILAGEIRSCQHCGRLLYDKEHHEQQSADAQVTP